MPVQCRAWGSVVYAAQQQLLVCTDVTKASFTVISVTHAMSCQSSDAAKVHTHTHTHAPHSFRGAAVGVRHLLFGRPSSGLLAAHPCYGCQLKTHRCHPSVCHHIRSADWPLTEESPEQGSRAASRRFPGPPSFSATPWNGRLEEKITAGKKTQDVCHLHANVLQVFVSI